MEKLRALGAQLIEIWSQLGVNQKVTVMASGVLVAAGLAVVIFFTSRTDFALLYSGMDPKDAGAVIEVLDEQSVPYEAGAGGTSIKVPRSKVHELRMTLASRGLPKASGSGLGYSIFDSKASLTMSDFVQQVNLRRALQGELGMSIAMMQGVDSARVMVVMPETRLIVDESKRPTASVFVNLRAEGMLGNKGVQSIRFLVANSVPGLKHTDVSVVDNFQNTLSANEEAGSVSAMANTRLAVKRNLEKYYVGKVHNLLSGVLGPGQVYVTVDAELDHDQVTHMAERYDPSGSVTNSVTEKIENTGQVTPRAGGVAGTPTTTNTSTNGANAALSSNQLNKTELTKSYNNSRSTTNVVKAVGEIRRLTASVVVNQQGETPRDLAAMTSISNLVAGALGMLTGPGAQRDDKLEIREIAFNTTHLDEAKAALDSAASSHMISDILRNALYVLLGAGALWAFVRLVNRSQDEVIQTGVPVGQLLAGAPMAVPVGGMPMPGAMMPTASAGGVDTDKQMEVSAKTLEEIEEKLKDPSSLSVDEIKHLRALREEEREKKKMLEELQADEEEEDFEVIEQEKQKMIMDFGLGQQQPERVNIEVLRDMIKDNPDAMAVAARRWMSKGSEEEDGE